MFVFGFFHSTGKCSSMEMFPKSCLDTFGHSLYFLYLERLLTWKQTYRPHPPSGSCTERRYLTISFFQASGREILATWQVMRRPKKKPHKTFAYIIKSDPQRKWSSWGCISLRHCFQNRTWKQEQWSAIVSSPVAVLSLELGVEVHALQSSVDGCPSSRGWWEKLTLRGQDQSLWQIQYKSVWYGTQALWEWQLLTLITNPVLNSVIIT